MEDRDSRQEALTVLLREDAFLLMVLLRKHGAEGSTAVGGVENGVQHPFRKKGLAGVVTD